MWLFVCLLRLLGLGLRNYCEVVRRGQYQVETFCLIVRSTPAVRVWGDLRVQDVVVVESAKVLREHVECLSGGTHGTAVGAVAVGCAQDVWSGFVDFCVDGVCSYTSR